MKESNFTGRSKLILLSVFVLPVIWAAVIFAQSMSSDLSQLLSNLTEALNNPFDLHWTNNTLKCIAIFTGGYLLSIGIYYSMKRNYRRREEHGSAKWGHARQLTKKYADKNKMQNLILTDNVYIGLDGRRHRRNLNVMVVGGSGAGKTRFYAKPNIMQCNTSFVVLDPKGEILRDTGNLLLEKGYEIRVLDLINLERSHGYNPFTYLHDDKDVLKLVNNIVRNTTPKGAQSNDPFWERAETALMEALILYLINEAPPEEQNYPMVMEMIGAAEVREEDEEYASILDELFERLEMRDPEHLAVKQYHIFKLAAGKTAKSILISLGVRLEKFNLPQIADVVNHDEMDFPSIGERKTALFAVIPDNDSSLNFIIGMMYTQLFQELYYQADHLYSGQLPVHVHFVMDEFANVALPDEFDKLLSTMRSREISVSIIIQNMAQLKALFEKQWESIVGNCDEFLYLGGNELSTHEYVSKLLGKETIDTNTYGQSKGRSGSYSTNWQISGRELLMPDEVRLLDNRHSLLFIRGERAVQDEKYDLLSHPNIKLTADGNSPPFVHGLAPYAIDAEEILLNGKYEDFVVLSEEELLELFEKNNMEEQQNENV